MTKFKKMETKEITLPNSGAKVNIRKGLTFGTTLEMGKFEDNVEANLFLVEKMVVSWDFTDDKDKPLPVTIDNIKELSPEDGNFIVTEVTGVFTTDEKVES